MAINGLHGQQRYLCRNGEISFFSSAPLEDITASSNKARGAVNFATGDFIIRVNIETFEFRKALMKRHFNEQYMESVKYPEAYLSGKLKSVDFSLIGQTQRTLKVPGRLTIHGVNREVVLPVTLLLNDNGLLVSSTFMIKVTDYDIKIPKLLVRNIAEEVEVKVTMTFLKAK